MPRKRGRAASVATASDGDGDGDDDEEVEAETGRSTKKIKAKISKSALPAVCANLGVCGMCGSAKGHGEGSKIRTFFSEKYSAKIALCELHGAVFTKTMSFMDVGDVVTRYHKEPIFKKNIQAGSANLKGASRAKAFKEEKVAQHIRCTIAVERRALILNAAEWKREFGQPPRARQVRYHPSMNVLSDNGKDTEKVWLFKWQPSHWRSVVLTQAQSAKKSMVVMPTEDHLFESQGSDILSWCADNHRTGWGIVQQEAMFAKLQPLADSKQDDARKSTAGASSCTTRTPVRLPPRSEEYEESLGDSDQQSQEPDDDDDKTTRGSPRILLSSICGAHLPGGDHKSNLKNDAAASPCTPSIKQGRRLSAKTCTTQTQLVHAHQSAHGHGQHATASIAGSEGTGQRNANKTNDVDDWVVQLDLVAAMQGAKLGVLRHHAGEALSDYETQINSNLSFFCDHTHFSKPAPSPYLWSGWEHKFPKNFSEDMKPNPAFLPKGST